MKSEGKTRGIIFAVFASILYGVGYPITKLIQQHGVSESGNTVWTCMAGILCYALARLFMGEKRSSAPTRKQVLLCTAAGVIGMWLPSYLFMVAYRYLSVTEVTMLHFLHPALIAVFMAAVYRQKITPATFVAILLSVGGMWLINGAISSGYGLGIVAAVLTGVFYAVYIVMFETSCLAQMDSGTATLYIMLAAVAAAALYSLAIGEFALPPNGTVWLLDIAFGVTSMVGRLFTALAVKALGATKAAFGCMLEPVVSCLIAVTVFKEQLTIQTAAGSVLVFLSVVCITAKDIRLPWRKANHSLQ